MKTVGLSGSESSNLSHAAKPNVKGVDKIFKICYNNYSKVRKEKLKMKRREDIVLRIKKLKAKPVENARLIRKWERILRNFDRVDNSNT